MNKKTIILAGVFLAGLTGAILFPHGPIHAADVTIPSMRLDVEDLASPQQFSGVMQIVFLFTIVSLAPSILIMMTSFTRIAVALSFLRQALGTQQTPPTQIIVGLSLLLTFFIMQPVWQTINKEAVTPYQNHEISGQEFLERSSKPIREFMLKHARKKDLALFTSIEQQNKPQNAEALSFAAILPAFVISELTTAFQIGFLLYIPFIILDMVVASILLSMGMMMLPPAMISMPFKLMLFVLVDGWNLLLGSLVKSFM